MQRGARASARQSSDDDLPEGCCVAKRRSRSERALAKKLTRCFKNLENNPRSHPNIKPLKGSYSGYYRYRVGDCCNQGQSSLKPLQDMDFTINFFILWQSPALYPHNNTCMRFAENRLQLMGIPRLPINSL